MSHRIHFKSCSRHIKQVKNEKDEMNVNDVLFNSIYPKYVHFKKLINKIADGIF